MEKLDTREWLLTNGLGSFASGTVGDAHTRTYHGWLIAALDPPSQRTLLLSHIEASLDIDGIHTDLGTNYWGSGDVSPEGYRWLCSFSSAPVPTWMWQRGPWQMTRELLLPHWTSTLASNARKASAHTIGNTTANATIPDGQEAIHEDIASADQLNACHRVLVRYRYDGDHPATLTLRPLIADRHFHHQQHASSQLQFSQVVTQKQLLLQAIRPDWSGTPWYLRWTRSIYHPDSVWYWDYCYPEETRRGLGDSEDLYSPGYLRIDMAPGQSITIEATVGMSQTSPELTASTFDTLVELERDRIQKEVVRANAVSGSPQAEAFSGCTITSPSPATHQNPRPLATGPDAPHPNPHRIHQMLLHAADQFITYRASVAGPTIMAGYPWFGDWGRDTLISIPGLALTNRRYGLAKGLLKTFAQHCEQGLIPNAFPDKGSQPYYNSLDASLWWIETLGLYLETTQDWAFVEEQYPTVQRIYKALMTGTLHDIRVDAVDNLLTWNGAHVALTWMDAVVDDIPVTPRMGKAIEINALWYSCLCWMERWANHFHRKAESLGDDTKAKSYHRQIQRYATQKHQVQQALKVFWNPRRGYFYDRIGPDDSPDPSIRPNAIIALSLAHCGFSQDHGEQALELAHNRLLTPYGLRSLDPANPAYKGHYAGNMAHRDRAYHQGTVWSWLLGPFARAWKRFHGDRPIPFNPAPLMAHIVQQDSLGSVSEIFDGDAPHLPQGATSQAWSVAELLRHWKDLIH